MKASDFNVCLCVAVILWDEHALVRRLSGEQYRIAVASFRKQIVWVCRVEYVFSINSEFIKWSPQSDPCRPVGGLVHQCIWIWKLFCWTAFGTQGKSLIIWLWGFFLLDFSLCPGLQEELARGMNLQPTQVYNWFANYRRRQKSRLLHMEDLNSSCPERSLASHTNEPQDKGSNTPQTAGLSLPNGFRMWSREVKINFKFPQEGKNIASSELHRVLMDHVDAGGLCFSGVPHCLSVQRSRHC